MLNHVIIMGRMTRDPELRRTASGTAVASFTLAVDRDFAAKDAQRETDFIDCVAWRSTGEFVSKYFAKGRMAVTTAAAPRWSLIMSTLATADGMLRRKPKRPLTAVIRTTCPCRMNPSEEERHAKSG